MNIVHQILACSVLVFGLGWDADLSAQEQKISCRAVPKAVHAAFRQAFPTAVINSCATELEEGERVFELTSREGQITRDTLYHADGKVIVVEESVPVRDTPASVQQALRTAMLTRSPGGKIVRSEKVMRDGTLLYEFRIGRQGKFTEILIDASGKEVPKTE